MKEKIVNLIERVKQNKVMSPVTVLGILGAVAVLGVGALFVKPVGENAEWVDLQFGVNALPTDGYDSFITAPLNTSDATVFVNDLPQGVTSSIYTIFSSDGRTPIEKISCTGKSSSPSRLTGCTRGLSLTPNADGSIDETGGTGSTHSKNARIAITDTINFSGKALAILNGSQPTDSLFLRVGTATTTDGNPCIAFDDGSNSTSTQICKNVNTDELYWSTDGGANTYSFTSSSITQLTASTTKGINITDSKIFVKVSSTVGYAFDDTGDLYRKLKAAGGLSADGDGLYIEGSHSITWTAPQTFTSTTDFLTIDTDTLTVNATSTLATTTINGTSLQPLIDGSDADSLHTHYGLGTGMLLNGRYRYWDDLISNTSVNTLDATANTHAGGGATLVLSTNATWGLSVALPGNVSTNALFDDGAFYAVDFSIESFGTTGDKRIGFGSTNGATPSFALAYNDSTRDYAGFAIDGGTLYAVTADEGVGATATNVNAGIDETDFNAYRIEFDQGTDVKFYINGTLVATHNTNLPNGAVTMYHVYGGTTNGEALRVLPFQITAEY